MSGAHTYLYEEIAESIRRQIVEGDLEVGDWLSPVREMARDWSCTPGTVHRAYRLLSDEGLVVSRRGKGTRIAGTSLQDSFSGNEGLRWGRWRWASVVNRAEQYLLEAAGSGFSADQAQSALTVAVARWRSLREPQADSERLQVEPSTLRFSGSHDLVVEHLAQRLKETSPPVEVELHFSGSLGGLLALMRGDADFAGVHIWDEETDHYNAPYVSRLLPGGQSTLLTLAHRKLGMIVGAGQAADWPTLEALRKRNVRLANRQRGSGTRLWLDAQLRRLDIDGQQLGGYASELTTHMAVAEEVASNGADVGIGIQAAAAALGLDFVPLARERYELVFPDKKWDTPAIKTLRSIVDADSFKRTLEALGGYDSSETGRVRKV